MSDERDMSGTLSRNTDKDKPDANPKWPDYKGKLLIGGARYWLSGWVRKRRDGSGSFLSLAVNPDVRERDRTERRDEPQEHDDGNLPF